MTPGKEQRISFVVKYMIIGLILLVLFAIFWLIEFILQIWIPSFLSFIVKRFCNYKVVIGLYILLLKTLTRVCVFPGSFSCWRRNVETHYGKLIARRTLNRI